MLYAEAGIEEEAHIVKTDIKVSNNFDYIRLKWAYQ